MWLNPNKNSAQHTGLASLAMYIVIHWCQEINAHDSSGGRQDALVSASLGCCLYTLLLAGFILFPLHMKISNWDHYSFPWDVGLPLVNYTPDEGFGLHLPLMTGQGNLVWTLTLQLVRLINHPTFFFLKSKLLHRLGWSDLSLTILPQLPKCLDDHSVPLCPVKSTNLKTSLWYSHK